MAWEKICYPKNAGGLKVMDLELWNKTLLVKLLWNLHLKKDTLWVKWIHAYYIKNDDLMAVHCKNTWSWILKATCSLRETVGLSQTWSNADPVKKFPTALLYKELKGTLPDVCWKKLFFNNYARPRANFCLWMCCHGRLQTKDRLARFGIPNDELCIFCGLQESITHLFFDCYYSKNIWCEVLRWLRVQHDPKPWTEGLDWILRIAKAKCCMSKILKLAFSECIYMVWSQRNKKISAITPRLDAGNEVCHVIAARCAGFHDLKKFVMRLDNRGL